MNRHFWPSFWGWEIREVMSTQNKLEALKLRLGFSKFKFYNLCQIVHKTAENKISQPENPSLDLRIDQTR